MLNDLEKYKQARQRIAELKSFYVHLALYVASGIFFVIYNLATTPDSLWFILVLCLWFIGLLSHAYAVFFKGSIFGKKWEEKKIEEMLSNNNPKL